MTTQHDHPVDPVRVAAAKARLIDTEEAARLAGLLGLLADATRSRILYALDLVLALEASQDSVGYALRVLRTAGLVSTRQDGRVGLLPAVSRVPGAVARALPARAGRPVPHRRRPRRLTWRRVHERH